MLGTTVPGFADERMNRRSDFISGREFGSSLNSSNNFVKGGDSRIWVQAGPVKRWRRVSSDSDDGLSASFSIIKFQLTATVSRLRPKEGVRDSLASLLPSNRPEPAIYTFRTPSAQVS